MGATLSGPESSRGGIEDSPKCGRSRRDGEERARAANQIARSSAATRALGSSGLGSRRALADLRTDARRLSYSRSLGGAGSARGLVGWTYAARGDAAMAWCEENRLATRLCPMANEPRPSSHRTRARESVVEAAFRRGDRANARQLRSCRRPTFSSPTARLVGAHVGTRWLVEQVAASSACHLGDLSPVVSGNGRAARARPRQSTPLAVPPATIGRRVVVRLFVGVSGSIGCSSLWSA